jgi:hypothetical protein
MSAYVPMAGKEFVEPGWKAAEEYRDYIHPRAPTYRG